MPPGQTSVFAAAVNALQSRQFPAGDDQRTRRHVIAALTATGMQMDYNVDLDGTDTVDVLISRIGVVVCPPVDRRAANDRIRRLAANPRLDGVILVAPAGKFDTIDQTVDGTRILMVPLAVAS